MKEAIKVYGNQEVDTLTDQACGILLQAIGIWTRIKLPSLSRGH